MSYDSTVTPRVSYTGTGSVTTYAVPFGFIDSEDLVVVITDTSGVDDTQVLDTDYTVNGGNYENGYIIMTAAITNGYTLTIYRQTPKTQENSFTPYNQLSATDLENSLNKLTLITQELQDTTNRVVHISETAPISDLTFPDPSASKVIAWNSGATALENVDMSTAVLNINSLTAATIDISGDYIPFYDTSAAGNRKTLPQDIPANISGLVEDLTPDAASDYMITYDASAGVNKKVKLENFPLDTIVAAPVDASYVVLGTNTSLSNERVLTAGSGVSFTDAGAGSTLTAALNINGLTTENTLATANDLIAFYDASATANRKTSVSNLLTYLDITALTNTTTVDQTADYMVMYDASAGANRKVLASYFTGDWVKISTTTVSGTPSTIDITLDTTTYQIFRIALYGVECTTTTQPLQIRLSNDGGSTYVSSASSYLYEATAAATQIAISPSLGGATPMYYGFIDIEGCSSASLYTSVSSLIWRHVSSTPTTTSSASQRTMGIRTAKELNNAIRIFPAGGTFTTTNGTGTLILYGAK